LPVLANVAESTKLLTMLHSFLQRNESVTRLCFDITELSPKFSAAVITSCYLLYTYVIQSFKHLYQAIGYSQ